MSHKLFKVLENLSSESILLESLQEAGTVKELSSLLSEERNIKNMELQRTVTSFLNIIYLITKKRKKKLIILFRL